MNGYSAWLVIGQGKLTMRYRSHPRHGTRTTAVRTQDERTSRILQLAVRTGATALEKFAVVQ